MRRQILKPEFLLTPKEQKTMSRSTKKRLKKTASAIAKTTIEDPKDALAEAKSEAALIGLEYSEVHQLRIERRKKGKTFFYVDEHGKKMTKKETLERIAHLALPPAWTDVRIAHNPKAHLQATGRDTKGRLQYRYHPLWRTVRELTKFHRMIPFGETLPRIRKRVGEDLQKHALSRENVLATVVRLLDATHIRIGNEEYAEQNHSYGLTTMQNRHADIHGSTVTFRFRGKSGKMHMVSVTDRRLARLIHQCQDLPGQHLFEYEDADGAIHAVTSTDVNLYLHEISGEHFTAKDFRTWAGTVSAALCLEACEVAKTQAAMKQNIIRAVTEASEQLGNTPAICRKSYVHPMILQCYECQTLRLKKTSLKGLTVGEAAVLEFLRGCVA